MPRKTKENEELKEKKETTKKVASTKTKTTTTTKKSGYTFLGWGYHKYARLLIFKIKKRTY